MITNPHEYCIFAFFVRFWETILWFGERNGRASCTLSREINLVNKLPLSARDAQRLGELTHSFQYRSYEFNSTVRNNWDLFDKSIAD